MSVWMMRAAEAVLKLHLAGVGYAVVIILLLSWPCPLT